MHINYPVVFACTTLVSFILRKLSRLLYLLIAYYLTSPHITFLPAEIFGWKSAAGTLEPSFFSLYQTSVQLNLASTLYYTKLPKIPPYPKVAIINLNLRISFIWVPISGLLSSLKSSTKGSVSWKVVACSRPKLSDCYIPYPTLNWLKAMIPFTVAHMIPLSNPHMAVSTTPPPWHYCKPTGKQVAEMWQASFSSTVDFIQVSILINAVIMSFLPGIAFSRFLTNGFFRFFLIPSHVVLLVLSDIFHHHIT